MDNFADMLRGIDKETLQNGMQQAVAFSETAEGREMVEKIKKNPPTDKDSLMKMLAQNPNMLQWLKAFLKN